MNPTVVAAVIAAAVSVLTLMVTMAVQYRGYRAASRVTEKTLKEQREHLDLTLAEQSGQLDRTLAEQRTRTWNERFATAANQLGSDKPAAVRLAGVYAMAGLADDWEANRQTCINVLCAYLRMPYEPDPGKDSPVPEQHFSGGKVSFVEPKFMDDGLRLVEAEFSGCAVDFSRVGSWSSPPKFPWKITSPSGVKLPSSGTA
jgi:hypothetical protein